MTIVETTRPVTGGVDTHARCACRGRGRREWRRVGCCVVRDDTGGFGELHGWLARLRCGRAGRGGRHRRVRCRPGAPSARPGSGGDRGRSAEPPGTPPQRQVRRARRDRSGAGGVVGPRVGDREVRRWRCRSDPRVAGRAPLGPQRAHQVPEPDPSSRLHRPRRAAGTVRGTCHRDRLARRPRPRCDPPRAATRSCHATKLAIATLGRRVLALEADAERLDHELETLVRAPRPSLLEVYGVGIDTAAILLVAAGDNPHRIRTKPRSRTSAVSLPSHAVSGKTIAHRLNRGGNRQANHALWRIVFTRMSGDEPHPHLRRSAASPKDAPNPRSCASSSATSPARSTSTSSRD